MSLDDVHLPAGDQELSDQTDPSVDDHALRIRCANCGELLADAGRTIALGGTSTPVFVNPAGMFFELLLLECVTNVCVLGPPTAEATWYPGWAWQFAICRLCARHVGWRWQGSSDTQTPQVFWGLIRQRIVVDWLQGNGDNSP